MREFYSRLFGYDRKSVDVWPTLPQDGQLGSLDVAWCYVALEKFDHSLWMVLGPGCSMDGCETLVFTGAYFQFWNNKSPQQTMSEAGVKEQCLAQILEAVPELQSTPLVNREFCGSLSPPHC